MKVIVLHEPGAEGQRAADALAGGARRVSGAEVVVEAWPAAGRPAGARRAQPAEAERAGPAGASGGPPGGYPGPIWEADAAIFWTGAGAAGWISCGRLEAPRADPGEGFARLELEAFGQAVARGAADATEAGYPALARERAALSQPDPEEVPDREPGPPGAQPPAPVS